MIRDINFTGRHSLDNCFTVLCRKGPESDPTWTAEVELRKDGLERLGLPESAVCLVDVYLGSRQERFVMGEGEIGDRYHDAFKTKMGNDVYFNMRLKIVDANDPDRKILAAKLQISPETVDTNGNREPLLPVRYDDGLGSVPWRLYIDDPAHGSRPELVVNSKMRRGSRRAQDLVRRDPMFVALVLPEVLRRILTKFVVDADEVDGEERWVKFALKAAGTELDDLQDADAERRMEFVDAVVERFCDEHEFLVLGEEGEE